MTVARAIGPDDTVLVTGAGGVGVHIARALVDAGCDVHVVDQRSFTESPAHFFLEEDELIWHQADLVDINHHKLVRGCAAVIHTAAIVDLTPDYDDVAETNVDTVQYLVDACNDEGVQHFLFFSDGAIYEPARGLLGEEARVAPTGAYEESKFDAEQIVRNSSGNWTIIRPALVYGPGCSSMTVGLFTLPPILRNFLFLLPGFVGGPRANWCHVEDLAAATLALLGNAKAYGEVFNVGDDTAIASGEVFTAIAEAYDLPIGPMVPFPNSAALVAFSPVMDLDYVEASLRTILRQVWKRICDRNGLETPLRPKVDSGAIAYVADDRVLDNAKLKAVGWQPERVSFVDGVASTVDWYQNVGWAPKYDIETHRELSRNPGVFGFTYTQTVPGTWTDAEGSVEPFEMTLDTEIPSVAATGFSGDVNGTVMAVGLTNAAALEGTVDVKLVSERSVTYDFAFTTDDDSAYRCHLRAEFNVFRPFSSMSRLEGTIVDTSGIEIGRVTCSLSFAEQVVPLLLSFRPLR